MNNPTMLNSFRNLEPKTLISFSYRPQSLFWQSRGIHWKKTIDRAIFRVAVVDLHSLHPRLPLLCTWHRPVVTVLDAQFHQLVLCYMYTHKSHKQFQLPTCRLP